MRRGFPSLFVAEARVPSLHSFVHLCYLILGAYTMSDEGTVNDGAPDEFAEHFNRALQLIQALVRSRSYFNAFAYLNLFCKLHNDAVTRAKTRAPAERIQRNPTTPSCNFSCRGHHRGFLRETIVK